MRTRRPKVAAAAMIAAFLVAAACGGGDSTRPAASASDGSDGSGGGDSAGRGEPTPTPTADTRLPWGPTEAEYERAKGIVDGLSVAQKAGQSIVATFDGYEAPTELVRRLHLGGVILMGYNIDSADQVRAVNQSVQQAAKDDGRTWPAITSVDQEGGTVARLGSIVTELPAYMTFGAADDADLASRAASSAGKEMRALGFTMVHAPDADVTIGEEDPTIRTRSAGSDPERVGRVVAGSVDGYAESGIVATAKHYPGHGSVPADSHQELPVQDASKADLEKRDLVPFRVATEAGLPATMVAHIDVRAIDAGTPSTLSKEVVDGTLRDDTGFEGVAISDAMNMAALTERYGTGPAAVKAMAAGMDLLLMPADPGVAHAAIVAAVKDGTLPESRLDEAATRSIALMVHQRAMAEEAGAPKASAVGGDQALAEEASAAGMTMVKGKCSGRLVGDAVRVVGGSEEDRAAFTSAAEDAGLTVGSGSVVRLLGPDDAPGSGDVAVTLRMPYDLSRSDAETKIALYDDTPGAFGALAKVLVGDAEAGGTLPVDVPGAESKGCPAR